VLDDTLWNSDFTFCSSYNADPFGPFLEQRARTANERRKRYRNLDVGCVNETSRKIKKILRNQNEAELSSCQYDEDA
jgi:hypothetical protein